MTTAQSAAGICHGDGKPIGLAEPAERSWGWFAFGAIAAVSASAAAVAAIGMLECFRKKSKRENSELDMEHGGGKSGARGEAGVQPMSLA